MNGFSEKLAKEIENYLQRYETKRSAILPVLHTIQDEYGWIKEEHLTLLEEKYGLNRIHVKEVVSFYSMYRTKEPARFQILVCNNITCSIMGADETIHEIEKHISHHNKEQKEPCPYSVEGVPCLGVCDQAPAVLVNKDRHPKITEDKVKGLLAKYVC